ncbi:rhamnulokinase [Alicyclobacillaceae bacterium I2511]|nr:rhamnulokinase [Alicyclobacillaceae bacterium I2511]
MAQWRGIAVDLGASHGRVMLGEFDGNQLHVTELSQFPNTPAKIHGNLIWDYVRIYQETISALHRSLGRGLSFSSIGIDSWGVDFGLINKQGELLDMPRHYRNDYFQNAMDSVFAAVDRRKLYMRTGIQVLRFNTIFQLTYLHHFRSYLLDVADKFLLIPDLLSYHLTGNLCAERTIASTTQLLGMASESWNKELIHQIQIPKELFPNVVETGNVLGIVQKTLLQSTSGVNIQVINVGEHDTASAFAAMADDDLNKVLISSGTWSLIGVVSDKPLITGVSYRRDITNERSVDGRYLVMRNMTGLWLIQELERLFSEDGNQKNIAELTVLATQSEPLRTLIDPDAEDFLTPVNMIVAIQEYAAATGQSTPRNVGELCRTVFDSLVLKYRLVITDLEHMIGRHFTVIRIVGGGALNETLCQWLADATGKVVVAGPGEATVFGNLGVQLVAAGELRSTQDIPLLVERSCEIRRYWPTVLNEQWERGYTSFLKLN